MHKLAMQKGLGCIWIFTAEDQHACASRYAFPSQLQTKRPGQEVKLLNFPRRSSAKIVRARSEGTTKLEDGACLLRLICARYSIDIHCACWTSEVLLLTSSCCTSYPLFFAILRSERQRPLVHSKNLAARSFPHVLNVGRPTHHRQERHKSGEHWRRQHANICGDRLQQSKPYRELQRASTTHSRVGNGFFDMPDHAPTTQGKDYHCGLRRWH